MTALVPKVCEVPEQPCVGCMRFDLRGTKLRGFRSQSECSTSSTWLNLYTHFSCAPPSQCRLRSWRPLLPIPTPSYPYMCIEGTAKLTLCGTMTAGFIHGTHWSLGAVPSNAVMAMTCLGVLSMVTHLRTFSSERWVTRKLKR